MSGNPLAWLTPADFTNQLVALLPPGAAWVGVQLRALLQGSGDAFGDLHGAAAELSEIEMIPATTQQLLPDWEYDYGLPDPCTPALASTGQRVSALQAKIIALGGQSPSYFIGIAAAMGYAITITRFAPPRFGDRFGGRFYSDQWRFVWQVNCPANTITPARFGTARFGDRFATFSAASDLICRLQALQPAQGKLIFSFS